MSSDHDEACDPKIAITDDELVDRINRLARAQKINAKKIASDCCQYGLLHYETVVELGDSETLQQDD